MVTISASKDQLEYTSFGSAINLEALHGKKVQGVKIVAATASATITVRTEGSGDTVRVWNVAQGEEIICQLRSIESVSNVTNVRVYIGD